MGVHKHTWRPPAPRDRATTARAVAAKLGITAVEAEVLPEDKGKVVERLRRQGRMVAMAGDGVPRHWPALAGHRSSSDGRSSVSVIGNALRLRRVEL
jgi:cation transport ATPase